VASAIERFLYGDAAKLVSIDGEVGDYFIAEMRFAEGLVAVRIASERRPYAFRWVQFGGRPELLQPIGGRAGRSVAVVYRRLLLVGASRWVLAV